MGTVPRVVTLLIATTHETPSQHRLTTNVERTGFHLVMHRRTLDTGLLGRTQRTLSSHMTHIPAFATADLTILTIEVLSGIIQIKLASVTLFFFTQIFEIDRRVSTTRRRNICMLN